MKAQLALACLALGACSNAMTTDASVPASLAAAETAFAAHSVREDMRAAFIAAFSADGVYVRHGWVVAREDLAARPAPPIVLDWRPQYVEVAASGELGLSTGPWKLTRKDKADVPAAYGQFVSIWRRAAGEAWKVEVDLGISHPQPWLWEERLLATPVAAAGGPASSLSDAEHAFRNVSEASGTRAAYAQFGAADLRLYRPGLEPRASRDFALSRVKDERLAWTVERIETAASGDFGYTRGSYASQAASEPAGYYLRAWRREVAGWRVLLDVAIPPSP